MRILLRAEQVAPQVGIDRMLDNDAAIGLEERTQRGR